VRAAMLVALVSLAGLGGAWSLSRGAGRSAPAEPGPGRAKPVDRGLDRVAADGVVEGARPEAALRPEVAGTLATVLAREGQEVPRGALLAELHNESQAQQVALATAELEIARARLARLRNGERPEKRAALAAAKEAKGVLYRQAKATWDRAQRLWEKRSISQDEHDRDLFAAARARAEMDEATAEHALVEAPARADEVAEAEGHVAAAAARLRLAEAELAKTRLLAPCAGRILRVFAEPGEMAGPATAQPVLLLADVSRRRVRAFVEELDAVRLAPGQAAAVTADGLPGREFRGKVALVAPRMGRRAPQSDAPGEYKDLFFREVLVDLDAGDELPINLRVQARIRVGAEERSR
jgi:HlyD family secretion protein